MNGIQIEHMINLLDENLSDSERRTMRSQAATYINEHMDIVLKSLAESGAAVIPTSNGSIRLTRADLELAAA